MTTKIQNNILYIANFIKILFMHEIKIYGYISNVAEKEDKEVSLLDVQQQLAQANGKDILCRINSHGGDAEEGFAIYYELRRYAKDNKAKVKTFAESRLGSIATIIFLAGDQRELTTDLQPFVHKASFDTDEELSESMKNELVVLNTRLAKHYADHTALTFEEAYELMDNDTFIPTEMALEMRFATSIESVLRPVAFKKFNTNKLDTDMNKNKKTVGAIAKAIAFLTSLGGSAVNKLVMTADEKEIDFYELEEDEVVEVGSNARIDGEDASGSYVMKSGETYVFEAGVLTEIIEASTETMSEDAVALQAEIDTLTAQLEQVVNASAKQIETLTAENAKKETIINNYKSIVSASAPRGGNGTPPRQEPNASKSLDEKVNNLKTIKLK